MGAYEIQKLVLFHGARHPLGLADVVAALAEGSLRVRLAGAFAYLTHEEGGRADEGGDEASAPAVRLSIDRGPHVLADARVIAERHGSGRSDRPAIANCDARIEVAWKPDEGDDVTDLVLALDPELEELVGGVTWSPNIKELSEGALPEDLRSAVRAARKAEGHED